MVTRDVLIIADLGAAGNLCRNLLLCHDYFDWPLKTDRITTIHQQYQGPIPLSQWLQIEQRMRFFDRCYGVDLSNDLDWPKYQASCTEHDKSRIFLNHSAFWQPDQLEIFVQNLNTIYVAPESDFALRWQIRSYVEKKTVQILHDFCFDSQREEQKHRYIQENGLESYYRTNITNMYHILKTRQRNLRDSLQNVCHIALEIFLEKDAQSFADKIQKGLGLNLDWHVVDFFISQWQALHWPIEDTDNWIYHDCFT